MRIVLQHVTSGLYVTESGAWTPNLAEAMDFGTSVRAIKYLRQERLEQVQVLVVFADSGVIDCVALQLPAARPAVPTASGLG